MPMIHWNQNVALSDIDFDNIPLIAIPLEDFDKAMNLFTNHATVISISGQSKYMVMSGYEQILSAKDNGESHFHVVVIDIESSPVVSMN